MRYIFTLTEIIIFMGTFTIIIIKYFTVTVTGTATGTILLLQYSFCLLYSYSQYQCCLIVLKPQGNTAEVLIL